MTSIKKTISIFSLVILFFWCLSSADSNIPNQPCKVYFRDKRIIISEPASGGGYGKEKEYSIKGVCYQSIPVGSDWDYFNTASDPEKRAVYERDFALLADAGFNTIRTWTEVNQTLLDLAYRYKIKVCLGFFVDYKSDLSNPAVRNEIKTRFTSYVTSFKNHPAVLFWMLGNEQNLTNGNNSSWYTLANELGGIAHSLEGAYRHPVAIVEGDLGNIGNSGRHANDSALSNIDLWASNVYRGKSFGSLFSDYKARSNKPLMISEYGVDAYDSRKGQEDEMTQMLWDRALWQEIASNNDVCVGATVMDYSDGWCKITPYLPTGYMGDFGNISMDDKFPQDNPSLGTKCIKFAYSGVAWAGVYWLFPADNWGNLGPGLDLSDYTKLRFWIKGNNGGEQVGFKLTGNSATICLTNEGGQDGSRICLPDDPPPYFALSPDWKEHVFDLKGYNLSNIRGGFSWVASSPCTFFLDKIRFESEDGSKVLYLYDDSSYADMIKEYLSIQDNNGFYFSNTFPDGRANEEWWGLVAVKKNGNGADIIKPRLAFYNLFKPISQGRPVTVMSPVVESLSLCVSKGFTKDKLNDGVKTSLAFPGGKWWDQALRSYLLFDYVIDLGGYYDIQKVKFNWLCSGNVIAYPTIDSWVFYYSDSLMHNWKAYLPASGMTKRGESVTERYTKIYTNKVRIKGYGRNYGGIYEMEVFGKKYPGYKILSERAM